MESGINQLPLKEIAGQLVSNVPSIASKWEELLLARHDASLLDESGLELFRKHLNPEIAALLSGIQGTQATPVPPPAAWATIEAPTLLEAFDSLKRALMEVASDIFPALDTRTAIELSDHLSREVSRRISAAVGDVLRRASHERQHYLEVVQQSEERRIRVARMMSHELRNGLNALTAAVDMFAEDEDPDSQQESIGICRHAIFELTAFLKEISDYSVLISRRIQLSPERVELSELLEEIRYDWEPVANAQNVSLIAEGDSGAVTVDRTIIGRLAGYLISNGIRAAKQRPGSRVDLHIFHGPTDHWRLEVQDNGPGIPPENIPNAFIEYARLEKTGSAAGAGLALTLAKGYAELLGGNIEVQSEVDRGSRFSASLPAHHGTAVETSANLV